LIDGTLTIPFFARDKNNQIISADTRAQWHNEMKGVMMINQKYKEEAAEEQEVKEEELIEAPEDNQESVEQLTEEEIEAEYQRYQAILKRRAEMAAEAKAGSKKKKLQFEIEYDYFFTHFWQGVVLKKYYNPAVSPMMVWSEIMSTIKGSADAYHMSDQHLSRDDYLNATSSKNSLISQANRKWIYSVFLEYEGWKELQGGYDFMDVVNHVLKQVSEYGYNGAPIHFLMIDEVQDLSHATITLLMKVVEQGVFFAGDTAQTIAKGVGIRFCDLSSLFNNSTGKYKPAVHQLTVSTLKSL